MKTFIKCIAWFLTVLSAICAVFITNYMSNRSLLELKKYDIFAKKYEITFVEKQKIYSLFMNTALSSISNATENKHKECWSQLNDLQKLSFSLEPYLESTDDKHILSKIVNDHICTCYWIMNGKSVSGLKPNEMIGSYTADELYTYINGYANKLYPLLFDEKVYQKYHLKE